MSLIRYFVKIKKYAKICEFNWFFKLAIYYLLKLG